MKPVEFRSCLICSDLVFFFIPDNSFLIYLFFFFFFQNEVGFSPKFDVRFGVLIPSRYRILYRISHVQSINKSRCGADTICLPGSVRCSGCLLTFGMIPHITQERRVENNIHHTGRMTGAVVEAEKMSAAGLDPRLPP